MYAITFKGRPATMEQIYKAEDKIPTYHLSDFPDQYLVARTKRGVINLFLYHIGFTWKERAKGIDAQKVGVIQ